MITVFSISILCFVIADLDNPFSGFFRLDLSLLNLVISRGQRVYSYLQEGQSIIYNNQLAVNLFYYLFCNIYFLIYATLRRWMTTFHLSIFHELFV